MSVSDAIRDGGYQNKLPYGLTRAQREAYREESRKIEQQFRSDIEFEFGMKGHPKADLLWRMAWERGHSSGYYSVYQEYDELVELVK